MYPKFIETSSHIFFFLVLSHTLPIIPDQSFMQSWSTIRRSLSHRRLQMQSCLGKIPMQCNNCHIKTPLSYKRWTSTCRGFSWNQTDVNGVQQLLSKTDSVHVISRPGLPWSQDHQLSHCQPQVPVHQITALPSLSTRSLQNRRMKWKKENKTKLDGPDMDESPESNWRGEGEPDPKSPNIVMVW